jgi:hypothetical protein
MNEFGESSRQTQGVRGLQRVKNYFFGRLVPYLERLLLRFTTPAVSRAPRTMV